MPTRRRVRLPFSGYGKYQNEQEPQPLPAEEPEGEEEADPFRPSATVYHPRLVSWNELDSEPEPEERRGYQVEAEEKKELSDRARRKKIRAGAIAACAVLGVGRGRICVSSAAGRVDRQPDRPNAGGQRASGGRSYARARAQL